MPRKYVYSYKAPVGEPEASEYSVQSNDDATIKRKTACFGSRSVRDSSAFGRLVTGTIHASLVLLDSSR